MIYMRGAYEIYKGVGPLAACRGMPEHAYADNEAENEALHACSYIAIRFTAISV